MPISVRAKCVALALSRLCFNVIAAVREPFKHSDRSTVSREPFNGERSRPLDGSLFRFICTERLE